MSGGLIPSTILLFFFAKSQQFYLAKKKKKKNVILVYFYSLENKCDARTIIRKIRSWIKHIPKSSSNF